MLRRRRLPLVSAPRPQPGPDAVGPGTAAATHLGPPDVDAAPRRVGAGDALSVECGHALKASRRRRSAMYAHCVRGHSKPRSHVGASAISAGAAAKARPVPISAIASAAATPIAAPRVTPFLAHSQAPASRPKSSGTRIPRVHTTANTSVPALQTMFEVNVMTAKDDRDHENREADRPWQQRARTAGRQRQTDNAAKAREHQHAPREVHRAEHEDQRKCRKTQHDGERDCAHRYRVPAQCAVAQFRREMPSPNGHHP